MNIFISGGCKNGKSIYAQKIAQKMAKEKGCKLYYLATMISKDKEDEKRIERHRMERAGWGFETIEQGKDILKVLDRVDTNGVFLFDSVTALLENEMFMEDYSFDKTAKDRVKDDLIEFAKRTGNTVFVSDYIYCDSSKFSDLTSDYEEALAASDRVLTKICENVIEVTYGINYEYKTGKFLKGIV